MAYRLIDHANGITDPVRRAMVEIYATSTDLLRVLPFVTVPEGVYKFDRPTALPASGFRQLNAGFTESTGTMERVVEVTYELGGDIDVDIAHARNGAGMQRAMQEEMQLTSIAQTFDYNFVKGDNVANRAVFDGIQTRCGTNGPSTYDVNGALSLSVLDEWIGYTRNPTHLLMTQKMRNKLTAASRVSSVSGNINYMKDDFGRQVPTYNDLPILIADPVGHGQKPIDNAEANDGGGDPTTSIYILSVAPGNGVFGIQVQPPDLRDLGELDSKPSFRTRVDWSCGLVVATPESVTRLRRIDPASAVVA